MVITLDSESSDPGSSPGRTWWFYFDNEYFFTMRISDNDLAPHLVVRNDFFAK